jgi:hypothetical protein
MLVPTFEKKFAEAAAAAVDRIQFGSSLLSIFAGMIALGGFFLAGVLLGSEVLYKLHNHTLAAALVWHELAWGTGLGIASPLLLIYVLFRSYEGARRFNWMEVVSVVLGVCGFITLLFHQFALFSF